jgi:hypothetical protein
VKQLKGDYNLRSFAEGMVELQKVAEKVKLAEAEARLETIRQGKFDQEQSWDVAKERAKQIEVHSTARRIWLYPCVTIVAVTVTISVAVVACTFINSGMKWVF